MKLKYLPLLFSILIFIFFTGLAIDFYNARGFFPAVSAIGYLIGLVLLLIQFANQAVWSWIGRVASIVVVICIVVLAFRILPHWPTVSSYDRRFLVFAVGATVILLFFFIRKEITGHGALQGWRRKDG